MVVTKYDENDDGEDEDETEGFDETPSGRARVKGRVGLDGPSLKKIPASQTPHCATQRERADVALRDGEWRELNELSRETKCWSPRRKARALRMNALFELGRYDECIRVGNGSNHPDIKKWTTPCTLRRG